MAIRLPKSKKANLASPVEPTLPNSNDLADMVEVVEIETSTSRLPPSQLEAGQRRFLQGRVRRVIANRRTLLMFILPLSVVAIIGLVTQIGIPGYQQYMNKKNQPSTPVSGQPKDNPTANTVVNNAQVAPATTAKPENLRTEAVVITGDQLGNGVASAPPEVAPPPANAPVANGTVSNSNIPVTENAAPNAEAVGNEARPNQSATISQSAAMNNTPQGVTDTNQNATTPPPNATANIIVATAKSL